MEVNRLMLMLAVEEVWASYSLKGRKGKMALEQLPGGNAISAVLSKVRASVTVYIYMFYVMFGKAEQFVSIFIFIKCCQP